WRRAISSSNSRSVESFADAFQISRRRVASRGGLRRDFMAGHWIRIQYSQNRMADFPHTRGKKEKALIAESLDSAGGASRNRTDVHGFAIRCITTLPL